MFDLSLQTMFLKCGFCLLPRTMNFLKVGHDEWVKGTEVNEPLVWNFVFIWLGARPCILLSVTVLSEGKVSSGALIFVSLDFSRDFLNKVWDMQFF